jgi:hypothetical protein
VPRRSAHVRLQDIKKLARRFVAPGIPPPAWINNMFGDVPFDNFVHQAADSAPACGDEL